MNQEDRTGNLPLHLAALNAHTELAQSLVKCGASVNQQNGKGDLPFHLAALNGHTELALYLIKSGASVNQLGEKGNLPLHLATDNCHTELALSLIKHGASLNHRNEWGDLPISYYVKRNKTDREREELSYSESDPISLAEALCTGRRDCLSDSDSDSELEDFFMSLLPERSVDLKLICELLDTKCIGG